MAIFGFLFRNSLFGPKCSPNRLVWPWIDVKSQKIDLLGDILPSIQGGGPAKLQDPAKIRNNAPIGLKFVRVV